MSESDIDIVQPTVVLFREAIDGQEAEYVEIIEDSDERLVVKATFGMVDEVVEALAVEPVDPVEAIRQIEAEAGAPVEGVGTASGHVVTHALD